MPEPQYPELCPTCKRPYHKPDYDKPNFCSDSFHCCRDCTWDWEIEGGFAKGQRVALCGPCEALERRWEEEWAQRSPTSVEPSEGA